MTSGCAEQRRKALKSGCTLVGAAAWGSTAGSVQAFAAGEAAPSAQTAAPEISEQDKKTRVTLHRDGTERDIPGAGSSRRKHSRQSHRTSAVSRTKWERGFQGWIATSQTTKRIGCIVPRKRNRFSKMHGAAGFQRIASRGCEGSSRRRERESILTASFFDCPEPRT